MAKKTVEIDEELYAKAEVVAKESGYKKLDELIAAMLDELVKENKGLETSEEDKKKVEERLKNLGYMD